MPSPAPVNKDSSIATGSSGKEAQAAEDAINQTIIHAFILSGRTKDEAEQWIRTSLRITRLYLQGSVLTQRERWKERYPSTSPEDIHKAVTSEIGAALWHLRGGVDEKYAEPRPSASSITGFTRSGTLLKYLSRDPEDPHWDESERRIARLKKEFERISKKVKEGEASLPYQLKNAQDWQLVKLGEKGKRKGHILQPACADSLPLTEADLREIREAIRSGDVTIEDDN